MRQHTLLNARADTHHTHACTHTQVCARLGLVSLAPLWRRPQAALLDAMLDPGDGGIHAVLAKVSVPLNAVVLKSPPFGHAWGGGRWARLREPCSPG